MLSVGGYPLGLHTAMLPTLQEKKWGFFAVGAFFVVFGCGFLGKTLWNMIKENKVNHNDDEE
ncbi:MAG: hypothetical protein HUJ72_04400 [Blautia sp.]|nr:hypothetical protein [Blautia sp.]